MVSNIDLLRKSPAIETAEDAESEKATQKKDLSPSKDETLATVTDNQEQMSVPAETRSAKDDTGTPDTRTTEKTDRSDDKAIDGILSRIIDRIESTDQRNNDALLKINDRLDVLADQLFVEKETEGPAEAEDVIEAEEEANTDLKNQVSDLSRQLSSARKAQASLSPRAVFEDKLAELTTRLEREAQEGTSDEEPSSQTNNSLMNGLSKLEELREEFSSANSDDHANHDALASQNAFKVETISRTTSDGETEPLREELAQSLDDEIASASLPQSVPEMPAGEATPDLELPSYTSEADAMEALAMGFEEQGYNGSDFTLPDEITDTPPPIVDAPKPTNIDKAADSNTSTAVTATATASTLQKSGTDDIGRRLDQLVAKFETVLSARSAEPLIQTIEAQISELPAYLDREENRQQRLEVIETNISSLTSMLQDTKAAIAELSEKIAEETATHVVNKLDWGTSADRLAAIDEYLRSHKENEQRQQAQSEDTLEAVYGALEQMVDRLEAIEPITSQQTPEIRVQAPQSFTADIDETEQPQIEPEPIAPAPHENTKIIADVLAQPLNADDDETDKTSLEQPHQKPHDNISLSAKRSSIEAKRTSFSSGNTHQPTTDEIDEEDIKLFTRGLRQEPDNDIEEDDDDRYSRDLPDDEIRTSRIDEPWDRQVPPYIAASQLKQSPSGTVGWARKHKTAFVAAIMVLLSAGGGLFLSQMSFLQDDWKNDPSRTQLSSNEANAQRQTLGRNVADQTGALRQSTNNNGNATPNLRNGTQNQLGGNQNTTASIDNNYSQPKAARLPAQQQTTPEGQLQNLPGVAIGHVSEKGIRQQLHQSVRQQQIAEMVGKNTDNGSPFGISQTASIPKNDDRLTGNPFGQAAQRVAAPVPSAVPSPNSTSAAQKQLPPPQIGPMSLRVAAANGDPKAEYEIGNRYARGSGVPQDLSEAARWFKRAASTGYAPAQYRLATHFERGAGITQDLDRAKIWYRRSAETGNVKAMHNYAVLHTGRKGVKEDYVLAAEWFKRAATHGLADSQFNLAILYENGLGIQKNLIEAYKWLTLASLNGDREAGKRREILRSQLEASAIAAAERAALEWKPEPRAKNANGDQVSQSGFGAPARSLATAALPNTAAPSQVPMPRPAPAIARTDTSSTPAVTNKEPDPLVKKAQQLLANLGYDTGPADGQVGPKTREAIIAFQRRAGMTVNGDVTVELLQRLASLAI